MSDRLWIVDQLGPDTAALETATGHLVTVRRDLLPTDAREGMVLRVTRRENGALVFVLDPLATASALARSAQQVTAHPDDPPDAGDIAL